MKKIKRHFFTVFVLAAAMLCLCCCGLNDDKNSADIGEISALPQVLLDALAEFDEEKLSEISPEYDADFIEMMDDDHKEIYAHMISMTTLEETGEVYLDKEAGTADMNVTLKYFPVKDYLVTLDYAGMTKEMFIDSIDEYGKTKEKTINFCFYLDEDDEKWHLEKRTARRVAGLFEFDGCWAVNIVKITPDEARDLFIAYLNDISIAADADSLPDSIDLEACRVYDKGLVRGSGEETDDAVARFVSAYMRYVLDHIDNVGNSGYNKYAIDLSAEAPSQIDLHKALETDEFYTEYYANWLRYSNLGADLDTVMDMQAALIYNTLADAVPSCSGEYYYITARVDPYSEDEPQIDLFDELINSPATQLMTSSTAESSEQYVRCTIAAIELLHSQGEIGDEEYEVMLDTIEIPQIEEIDTSVSSSGHENQAVGVYEYVPDWCEDGDIIYGYSEFDPDGFMMFYSKEPDWLNTAGYCIDDDGIWIATYYDRYFSPGTKFIADWWKDGEQIVDTEIIEVSEFTNEIEAFLPVDEFTASSDYELRLWEEDHRHVVAYVKIMR